VLATKFIGLGEDLMVSLRNALDRFTRALARTVLRIFYREITVVGAQWIPRQAPLVVVANHPNGLVDPALIAGFLPIRVRFLAKSTMWGNPALRPLLALAGSVPVYRRQDPGVDMSQNVQTFARCHQVLAAGGTVALFPEGHSHSEPGLLALKTGAARISLEAEERYGPLGVQIVPVYLAYEAKHRFRSRVRVIVGSPIVPARVRQAYADETAAVRALTMRIATRLVGLTPARSPWAARRGVRPARASYLLPLACLGVAVNAVPAGAAALVGRRVTRRLEMRASYTAITGLYLCPIFWLAVLAAVARSAGVWGALAAAVAGAVGSWALLRVCDWRCAREEAAGSPPLLPLPATGEGQGGGRLQDGRAIVGVVPDQRRTTPCLPRSDSTSNGRTSLPRCSAA
jgi:1-acyl-sn-glycerol-3-phosphate acyltransferase